MKTLDGFSQQFWYFLFFFQIFQNLIQRTESWQVELVKSNFLIKVKHKFLIRCFADRTMSSDIKHRISKVRHRTSKIGHQTSDIRHLTSDIKHGNQKSNIEFKTSDMGHQTSDIRHWTSKIRHRTSAKRHLLSDIEDERETRNFTKNVPAH